MGPDKNIEEIVGSVDGVLLTHTLRRKNCKWIESNAITYATVSRILTAPVHLGISTLAKVLFSSQIAASTIRLVRSRTAQCIHMTVRKNMERLLGSFTD